MKLNLPSSFKIIDNGCYFHEEVEYLCEPLKFIIKNRSNEMVIDYDEQFNPIKLTINGQEKIIGDYLKYNLIHLETDPRYLLKNYSLQNVEKFGLKGEGYITFSEEIFKQIDKITQIDNESQFTSYVFFNYKEFERQRWVYTIKKINE